MVEAGTCERVGLLATQGIRGGAQPADVSSASRSPATSSWRWSDEPWVLDGAAVHISFVGFDDGSETERLLDGSAGRYASTPT